MTNNYTIYNEDCLKQMDLLEENSIDTIITDPPYHLTGFNPNKGFLEREWDGGDIAFRKETWAKALRVLKPGGYLLAFGHSKTFHRLVVAVEDAGFEIRDTLMWLYGTGMPKSFNVGLEIDKLNGVESEVLGEFSSGKTSSAYQRKGTTAGSYQVKKARNEWDGWGSNLKPAYEPIVMARKPFKGSLVDNVLQHGTGALNIDGARNPENSIAQLENRGRFPNNVMIDGSDEILDLLPKNASRFFYTPKANKKDKNDAGLNSHVTVKPVELMRYLVRLVTPPNGVVLDPFMGSGSTGKAVLLESKENLTNSKFIGIEKELEYCEIAKARLNLANKN